MPPIYAEPQMSNEKNAYQEHLYEIVLTEPDSARQQAYLHQHRQQSPSPIGATAPSVASHL